MSLLSKEPAHPESETSADELSLKIDTMCQLHAENSRRDSNKLCTHRSIRATIEKRRF